MTTVNQSQSMKAVWIERFGGPEGLEIRTVPRPGVAADQVLVRVRASALNRADLLQRQGRYPAPPGYPQEIPGMEFAGEVAEIGPLVQMWKRGQRVFGLTGGGAQAQYLVTQERLLAEIPSNLDWAEAAAIPEVFITAHDALWKQAELKPGETVLIDAVGSGVGLASVQLVHAIHARAFGTSRTAGKIQRARALGLQDGIAVQQNFDELAAAVQKWTFGKGIDVVLDLAGGPYVAASQKLMAAKGRIILAGTMAGSTSELDSRLVMSKRLRIIGTVLRARPLEEKIQVTQAFAREVVPLLASGVLRPNIDSKFAMADIRKAHERLESNQTFGKVVIEIE
ncbi:MAG TPA: NAD(P)H-quinone oxidoreductase [Candidatus Angelobacter sp.]